MKKVLITGAAGGLGTGVVKKFLAEGYKVIATTLPGSDEQVNELKAIEDDAKKLSVYPVDVIDHGAVQEFAERLQKEEGTMDAAVLLVGGFGMGDLNSTTPDDLNKQISLNFYSAFNVAQTQVPAMKRNEFGRIVLVGAKPALEKSEGGHQMMAYVLSKTLVIKFAEMLNDEGAEHNVVTSVIAPGIIDTEPNRQAMPDADFEAWPKPAQLADVIAYACSDAAEVLRQPVYRVYGES